MLCALWNSLFISKSCLLSCWHNHARLVQINKQGCFHGGIMMHYNADPHAFFSVCKGILQNRKLIPYNSVMFQEFVPNLISLYWLDIMHLCGSIAFIWRAVFLLLASHLFCCILSPLITNIPSPLRLFSAALPQGAWSNRSAMSSPSWSPERSDAWDSPKTRPMHGLPIWTMRLVNEGRVLKGLSPEGDWAFKMKIHCIFPCSHCALI